MLPDRENMKSLRCLGTFFLLFNTCIAMNYQFARKLYDSALTNYTRHVKPRLLSAHPVNVSVDFCINSVIDFDEKSGVLTFLGKFDLKWWDEIIMWDKNNHGGLDMAQLSIHDVWVPKIVLGNGISYHSVYKFDNYFDSKMIYVTFIDNGAASISSSGVWETTCNSDISKFPFDTHACIVEIDAAEPTRDLELFAVGSGINVKYTSMHSEFKMKDTSVVKTVVENGFSWSRLTYTIKLTRKPMFMTMNLVVPVYIISVANLLVFFLPLDSSDRISFSVTMLLTLTVFMTMVADKLPATDSLSHFNTFLLLQMVFSTVITVCVLLLHYLYIKTTKEPPKWIDWVLKWKHKSNNSVEPIKNNELSEAEKWKTFAARLNKGLLIVFCLIFFTEFSYFYYVTCA